jgi:hypothetical protein
MMMTATVISPAGRGEVDQQQGSEQPTHHLAIAMMTAFGNQFWMHGCLC